MSIKDSELPNDMKLKQIFSFKGDMDITKYIRENIADKSAFLNRATRYYMTFLQDPETILKELKRRNPELYKKVNRQNEDSN